MLLRNKPYNGLDINEYVELCIELLNSDDKNSGLSFLCEHGLEEFESLLYTWKYGIGSVK